MKLQNFIKQEDYQFRLVFKNGEIQETNLKELIGKYVSKNELNTARINSEWGCLEFENGNVDVEPKTLYTFAKNH